MKIKKIFLLEKELKDGEVTSVKDNVDVVVKMDNGEEYIASFFTCEGMDSLRKENMTSGENLNGRFFWSKNMLITESCELEQITQIVTYLLDEGDFTLAFERLNK